MTEIEKQYIPEPHSPDFVVRYRVSTKVQAIEERKDGWYVHFQGSRESINLGIDQPPWKVGDSILILMQKV